MIKFLLLYILFAICIFSGTLWAGENIDHTGILTLKILNIPGFEDYSVEVNDKIAIANDIDWDTYPSAWYYRTRLREGLKQGPNFAGKYVIIMHGCGTSCQVYWVVNVETGKVLGKFGATYGAAFKKDSRLVIRNPVNFENNDPIIYNMLGAIDYIKVWDDELRFIRRIDIKGMNYEAIDSLNVKFK